MTVRVLGQKTDANFFGEGSVFYALKMVRFSQKNLSLPKLQSRDTQPKTPKPRTSGTSTTFRRPRRELWRERVRASDHSNYRDIFYFPDLL